MKKSLLIFILILTGLSCVSKKVKNNCSKIPFEQLDSITASKVVLNYKINLPEYWKKSSFSGGDWYLIDAKYIDSLGYYVRKANFYVSSTRIKEYCKSKSNYTIEDFLAYYIDNKSQWFRDAPFKYNLLKANHKVYGTTYLLKYKVIDGGSNYISSSFLIFYKNVGYVLDYRSETKNFDKYLLDVEKVIQSFRVNS